MQLLLLYRHSHISIFMTKLGKLGELAELAELVWTTAAWPAGLEGQRV